MMRFNQIKTETVKIILGVSFLFFCVIYYMIHKVNERSAMKDSVFVVAGIKSIEPSRGNEVIWVEYDFNGKHIQTDISVRVEKFTLGERVLLKVARKYPAEYVEYIKKIK